MSPKLKSAWIGFLNSLKPTHAMTIAYNNRTHGNSTVNRLPICQKVPLERIQNDVFKIHRDIDRKLFGTRFNKASARTICVGFVENENTNIHVHLAWTVPANRHEQFNQVAIEKCRSIGDFVSIEIKPVCSEGWAKYILKCRAAIIGAAELFVCGKTHL